MSRVTYSSTADLLIGDIQLPQGNDGTKYVEQAADEIDGRLGLIYSTPFNVGLGSPISQPSILLLKTLSIHISSGRAMMDLGTSGEDNTPNGYGKYILEQALAMLLLIQEGRVILDGAPQFRPSDAQEKSSRVLVSNLDPYSVVEAFYGWAAKPAVIYGGGSIPGQFNDGAFVGPFGG